MSNQSTFTPPNSTTFARPGLKCENSPLYHVYGGPNFRHPVTGACGMIESVLTDPKVAARFNDIQKSFAEWSAKTGIRTLMDPSPMRLSMELFGLEPTSPELAAHIDRGARGLSGPDEQPRVPDYVGVAAVAAIAVGAAILWRRR